MNSGDHRSGKVGKTMLVISGVAFIIVAVVLLFLFLLQGETKTTGGWHGAETTESLSCKANNLPYPIYESNNVSNSTTQINAIFNSSILDSISLLRKTNYANADIAKIENDALMAAMDTNFGKNGMKAFALNATFSTDINTAQMSLYVKQDGLNNKSMKYFMLDKLPTKIDDYQKAYQAIGFKCEMEK